jgi:nicotinamide phosphoribosyltransferase
MLHDFGYRGATGDAAAAIGGAAHLVNFKGTDTLLAMKLALRDYGADLGSLGFSVPATEHSVMTALGKDGEAEIVDRLVTNHPSGILSVVADSYNIYEFVKRLGEQPLKQRILDRDGVFVVRPDSVTLQHPSPQALVVQLLNILAYDFGTTETSKGFKVLNPKVRLLWGDGIDPKGIEKIINAAMLAGYSPENLVFGMGGGLLQKVNRDTQRFAFKSSAQKRDGVWHDVFKSPLDATKSSKKGRLMLVENLQHGGFHTAQRGDWLDNDEQDALVTVFENGTLLNQQSFDEIRERAAV